MRRHVGTGFTNVRACTTGSRAHRYNFMISHTAIYNCIDVYAEMFRNEHTSTRIDSARGGTNPCQPFRLRMLALPVPACSGCRLLESADNNVQCLHAK